MFEAPKPLATVEFAWQTVAHSDRVEKLSLRGVIPVSGKDRVLLIGQVGRGFDSELYYIQKFVTK